MAAEELCDTLDRLRQLHEELLDLIVEKEEALVKVRIDELETICDREESLLRRIIEIEKERLLTTEEIGDLLDHHEPASITVDDIHDHLGQDTAELLQNRRNSLKSLALRLSRQNSVNRALIEHSVGHIHVFMSKLASQEMGDPRYDDSGGASGGGGSGPLLMDRMG